jgi:hypothetical protein
LPLIEMFGLLALCGAAMLRFITKRT